MTNYALYFKNQSGNISRSGLYNSKQKAVEMADIMLPDVREVWIETDGAEDPVRVYFKLNLAVNA